MNPAALALALLLGHEARITDEQWSEVKAMALQVECPACKGAKCDQCNQQGWIVQHDLVLRDVRMTVDTGNVTDSSQRVVAPPCPTCEAAARERDDLHTLCDKQANLLSRVAVALRGPELPLTKWSHADLPERAEAAVSELADLRARLAAMADSIAKRETDFTDCRLAEHMQELCSCHDLANAIRDLLRKE